MTSPGEGSWANPSGAGPGWAAPGGPVPPAQPPPGPPPGYSQPQGYGPPPQHGEPRWGAPYQPLDLRPGIVPLRPLAVGDILDGALGLVRRYFRPVIAASVLVSISVQAAEFLIQTGQANTLSFAAKFGFFFLTILVSQLGGLLLAGPISAVAGEAVLGRPMSTPEMWAKVRPRGGAVVAAAVLVALISVVGIPFLAIPYLMALVYFSFSTQAVVLEKLPARQSMSRSIALVRGSFWRIFGIFLLAGLIAGIVAVVLDIPAIVVAGIVTGHLFTTAAAASSLTSRAILSVGGALAGIFTLPFTASVHSLLYMDQRMRNEGLDVSLRQAASTSGQR